MCAVARHGGAVRGPPAGECRGTWPPSEGLLPAPEQLFEGLVAAPLAQPEVAPSPGGRRRLQELLMRHFLEQEQPSLLH